MMTADKLKNLRDSNNGSHISVAKMITGGGEMTNDRTTDATADKDGISIQVTGNNTKDGMMTETGTAADADDPNWACQAPSLAVVTVDAEDVFLSMQM